MLHLRWRNLSMLDHVQSYRNEVEEEMVHNMRMEDSKKVEDSKGWWIQEDDYYTTKTTATEEWKFF